MDIETIATIIVSILGSSLISVLITSIVLEPMKDKKKYIFDEKKRIYESIIVFAQIVIYPVEAKYSLGVARYDIQSISTQERVIYSLRDLKMSIPKVKLITKNRKVIHGILNFIEKQDELSLENLTNILRDDLFK